MEPAGQHQHPSETVLNGAHDKLSGQEKYREQSSFYREMIATLSRGCIFVWNFHLSQFYPPEMMFLWLEIFLNLFAFYLCFSRKTRTLMWPIIFLLYIYFIVISFTNHYLNIHTTKWHTIEYCFHTLIILIPKNIYHPLYEKFPPI